MDIREYVKNQDTNTVPHPWETSRYQVIKKLIKKIHLTTRPVTIVDIGCGDVKVLNAISENDTSSRFIGIDTALDNNLITQIKASLNKENIELYKSLKEVTDKNIEADIILILDVLEHIKEDSSFFKNIVSSTLTRKETSFIITVPAFQYLFVQRDHWLGHYRRYTLKTIKKYANENDLEILKIGYFFSSLVPLRLLQKLTEKKKQKEQYLGISDWKGSKTIALFIEKILILDFILTNYISFFGIKLPGLSCYLVCKKP